jgi:hypothetical protein
LISDSGVDDDDDDDDNDDGSQIGTLGPKWIFIYTCWGFSWILIELNIILSFLVGT